MESYASHQTARNSKPPGRGAVESIDSKKAPLKQVIYMQRTICLNALFGLTADNVV